MLGISPLQAQEVLINEFMSANDSTLQDRDGDYPDWIELYNPGQQSVNLHNYGLSDDASEARKWLFPEIHLPAGGFLVIFASGKDSADLAELHTNFKISSKGEFLILTNYGGAVIHTCDSVNLADDVSLARIPDGGATWVQSSIPTPGTSNRAENQLIFSWEQGFYNTPFLLEISSLTGDPVYYTVDGSPPTPEANLLSGGIFLDYTEEIADCFSSIPSSPKQSLINYKAWELPAKPVDKANVIRSASYRDGVRTSPVYTKSYFVKEAMESTFSLPVISLVTDSLHLFDAEYGIYVPGQHYDSGDPQWSGNYFQKGREWERPVHLSYFSKEGDPRLSQDAGFRIHGGMTRHAAQKTLRLYARDSYGQDEFDYPLLPQKDVRDYERFLLRTTMGSWRGETILADILAHELVRNLDFEIMDYQPVIVYLNGEYWGMHTLRDRVDERYIEYSFGIDEDSVDIINANIGLIDAGSNVHYMELARFIESHDLSVQDHYKHVETQIDISSFVDYMVAEMFFANSDWPGNNQKLWRPQTADGKWRWIFMDLDAAYHPEAPDIFDFAMYEEGEMDWTREPVSSFLFRNLLKNEQFTSRFIQRFAEILNKEFTPANGYRKLEQIKSLYTEELPRHINRWGYPSSVSSWHQDVEKNLMNFLKSRPCEVARQVVRYFNLEKFGFSCTSGEDFGALFSLAPNPSDGHFYIGNSSPKSLLFSIRITDVSGRIVYTEEDILLEAQEKKNFSFMHLAGGIYYVSLMGSGQHNVKALVIY
jgi:hypothetical protein